MDSYPEHGGVGARIDSPRNHRDDPHLRAAFPCSASRLEVQARFPHQADVVHDLKCYPCRGSVRPSRAVRDVDELRLCAGTGHIDDRRHQCVEHLRDTFSPSVRPGVSHVDRPEQRSGCHCHADRCGSGDCDDRGVHADAAKRDLFAQARTVDGQDRPVGRGARPQGGRY